MDISKIKADKVNTTYGFKIGQESAPVKVIEFINLSCPYCKKWYVDSKDALNDYVHEGKIQRIIKLFDKEKPSLKKGNVVHHHLDYKKPEESLIEIDYFLTHQDDWKNLANLDQVAEYAVEKRGLSYQPNEIEINGIINEANDANVIFVPSVFIGDNVFDEHITPVELKKLIDEEYAKNS